MEHQTAGEDLAGALSEAIRARGLSLERIRHRLQQLDVTVSVATLSYWQNGRSQPTRAHSGRTLSALEEVLELPAGSLTSLAPLAPTRRRSGNGPGAMRLPETVEQVLAQTGLNPTDLRKVSTHVQVGLDENRCQRTEVVRNVVQCLRAGTRSFPVVAQAEQDGAIADVITGLKNCTPGRRMVAEAQQLAVTEMLLPRALRQGELMMLEYQTDFASQTEVLDHMGMVLPKLQHLVLEVTFAPNDLPGSVVAWSSPESTSADDGREDAEEIPVDGGVAQYVRIDSPAGFHSVAWQWSEDLPAR